MYHLETAALRDQTQGQRLAFSLSRKVPLASLKMEHICATLSIEVRFKYSTLQELHRQFGASSSECQHPQTLSLEAVLGRVPFITVWREEADSTMSILLTFLPAATAVLGSVCTFILSAFRFYDSHWECVLRLWSPDCTGEALLIHCQYSAAPAEACLSYRS